MGWIGSILGGKNENLNQDINQSDQIAGFGQTLGEGDLTNASNFYNDILSGDSAKQASVLAPEISNIQKQGQQQINTAAQFGNRSGGTNAAEQNNIDTQRGQVSNLVSGLMGKSASGLASIGQGALNTGLSANQLNAAESEQRMKNWQDSILGKGLSTGAQFAETGGLGALAGGMPGGPGSAAGAQAAWSDEF